MIIFTQCSVSTAASSSSWERTDKRVVLEEALGSGMGDPLGVPLVACFANAFAMAFLDMISRPVRF